MDTTIIVHGLKDSRPENPVKTRSEKIRIW